MISRIFQNIPDGKINESDQQAFLLSLGWSRGITWDSLLRSRRILVISEAGAGKTYECRAQMRRLWAAGEAAFFVELATLATEDLRSLLDEDEEARLDTWLSSQSDVATFFLDSIDELKLTRGSFELALRRLKKVIGSQLRRARIVITTRPIPFDELLIRKLLPVPSVPTSEPSEERFAKIAMRDYQDMRDEGKEDADPDWRLVALMPLSDEQILAFVSDQGVIDPDSLLDDLRRRNAQDFARRPQDLIELCADWREHKRIRTHRDQVTTNIRVKLLPREDRSEPAELSVDKAIEGVGRLALAMHMTRRLTIRHSAASDVVDEEAALDPAIILSDWQPGEQKALLERPLFGFASYGRVRFHHRSVAEFLAAERLVKLREKGMSFRALKRLLFAETKGKTIVRPSKRAVAGWLALQDIGIFELLRDNEPSVLINEGDPESLTQTQRNQALRAYCAHYGSGGWRGLQVPSIQVHRLASKELSCEIIRLWQVGVENPDVREVLISLVESGRITPCADIVYHIVRDADASIRERMAALDALVSLNDARLGEIAVAIATAEDLWPDRVARIAVRRLFPKYLSVEQLCQTLRWIKHKDRSVGDLNWQLIRLIPELDFSALEKLREGLVVLVSEGLRWQTEWPHITSDRAHLSGILAATCERGLDSSLEDGWFHACVLALRLHHPGHGDDNPVNSLRNRLDDLNMIDNARLFWAMDALLQSLHKFKDPLKRFVEVTIYDGPVQLRSKRDLVWVSDALGDVTRNVDERAMLLEAAIRLVPDGVVWKEHVKGLRPLVADETSFIQRIDEWLKPSKLEKERRRREKEQAVRKKQEARQKAKNRASWILFWREIANQPEDAFSPERDWSTTWNLWRAMRHDGEDSRSSGWNRRFIEDSTFGVVNTAAEKEIYLE